MWRSSFLANLQSCRLIASNFAIKWTPSQVFFDSILSPPMLLPPCIDLSPPPIKFWRALPPNGVHSPPMFSTPVGNPAQTQPSSQINIIFFLQTNGWISYITKSRFRSVECFWTHLRLADNLHLTMVFVGINLVPRASFLTQYDWSAFFSNQSLCVRKEALGTRLSGHASLLSFQTQQEQTVFIR